MVGRGKSASRLDTTLTVQTLVANNNNNFDIALAA